LIVNSIRPAVEEAHHMAGDTVENSIRAHTIMTVAALKASHPILAEHVEHGDLKIVGARYDLGTGLVEIIA
jgi:carbonic anhydrase